MINRFICWRNVVHRWVLFVWHIKKITQTYALAIAGWWLDHKWFGQAPDSENLLILFFVLLNEIIGARVLWGKVLAPRLRIAPLSFAPTRTEPKNSKFYGPDPGRTRLYFPRTGPDQNNLASTQNLQVSTRTDPKIVRYGKYVVLRSKI